MANTYVNSYYLQLQWGRYVNFVHKFLLNMVLSPEVLHAFTEQSLSSCFIHFTERGIKMEKEAFGKNKVEDYDHL